jgi:hypothetical protein
MLYAVDIAAWDIFFGLALLFAVPAFARGSKARAGLIASGSLCLIGLVGPFTNALGWRAIRIFGIHDRVRADLHPAEPDVRLRTSHRLRVRDPRSRPLANSLPGPARDDRPN